MARSYERVQVLILAGLDTIHAEVYGHELPILVHVHGGNPDKLRFFKRGDFGEIEDPEFEYKRMLNAYRSDERGVPVVDQVYSGGPLAFHAAMDAGGHAIDGLEQRAKARGEDGTKILGGKRQPKKGEDDYLDKKELATILLATSGQKVTLKSVTRNTLRAHVVLALEEAMLGAKLPIPALETDPDIGHAFRAYEAWRAANPGEGEGEGEGEE